MTVENLQLNVKTNAGDAAKQFGSLANALSRIKGAANAVPHSKLSSGIRKIGEAAKKATGGLNGFMSTLLRIAKYRFFRSVIKEITSAFSEGLQNAYAFSDAIATEGHRFASALDSMSSAGLKMKNQLGSALISLLAMVEPVINAILNLITRVADAMSQLFAVFTGGTYLKAIDAPKKWADAAGGAAKKAKEWKNQLLGFDEINRLEEPSNNSGGGGSDATDFMSMFEDTPISGIFAKIKEKVDELKESLNFEPLRQAWDRLKESVGQLADTIGQGLGWAWYNILVPLSQWTIEELAPQLVMLLANAFSVLNAVLQRLAPYFEWFWQNVLKPCFEFIGRVVIKELQSLNGFLEKLAKLINGEITFKEFIEGLTNSETIMGSLVTAVALVYGAIGIFNTVVGIATTVTGLFSTALAFFAANPAVLVVAAIAAIIAIGVLLYKNWDTIIEKLKEFQQKVSESFNDGKVNWLDFVHVVEDTVILIITPIKAVIEWIVALCNWIWTALNGLSNLLDGLNIAKKADAHAAEIEASGELWSGVYASGGFPTEGQLFLAREAGPELVGTMGGNTAVANNDQIVEGIRQGVFEAVMAANSNGERQVDVRVYLDSREIKIGQDRYNRSMGVA